MRGKLFHCILPENDAVHIGQRSFQQAFGAGARVNRQGWAKVPCLCLRAKVSQQFGGGALVGSAVQQLLAAARPLGGDQFAVLLNDIADASEAIRFSENLQTHLAETPAELDWVQQLFPERRSYLDVYQHYGLAGPRTLHAHCIHLSTAERHSMAASGAAAAFCPGSNLFLGSGFFDLDASRSAGLRVGLATDIGAGTGFGLLRTLAQAYEVGQALGAPLPALRGFYLATLGGAQALYLDDCIGSFQPGREADFIALDWAATPELAWRMERCQGLAERLFALIAARYFAPFPDVTIAVTGTAEEGTTFTLRLPLV